MSLFMRNKKPFGYEFAVTVKKVELPQEYAGVTKTNSQLILAWKRGSKRQGHVVLQDAQGGKMQHVQFRFRGTLYFDRGRQVGDRLVFFSKKSFELRLEWRTTDAHGKPTTSKIEKDVHLNLAEYANPFQLLESTVRVAFGPIDIELHIQAEKIEQYVLASSILLGRLSLAGWLHDYHNMITN